jgi:hypothetical protein
MIVKVTVIIGRTTPEMRLNISAKIKITMNAVVFIGCYYWGEHPSFGNILQRLCQNWG